jgi:hypothetical protein
VQVSLNGFTSCIAIGSLALTNGYKTLTLTPAPGLLVNRAYKVRVTTGATSNGVAMTSQYTQATGFTTASPNLCDSSVVISQVFSGGGQSGAPYTNDFVELHNRSTSPVDITGWTVQYTSATGTTWTQSTALSGIIPAGGFWLVQEASSGSNGSALPTADTTGTIAMQAVAGKVALVKNGTALTGGCPTGASIADFVGYGTTADCKEGNGTTPAPSITTSVTRAGSCGDTQNNATDFTAGTPNARNKSTTAACSCTVLNESDTAETNYCIVQSPKSETKQTGTTSDTIYGQIWQSGMTPAAGANAAIRAQLGYGPLSKNPQYETGWTWFNAAYNAGHSGDENDEYQATFTMPAAGSYGYAYRFSLDNGVSWTLCDANGSGSNTNMTFNFSELAPLTSTP